MAIQRLKAKREQQQRRRDGLKQKQERGRRSSLESSSSISSSISAGSTLTKEDSMSSPPLPLILNDNYLNKTPTTTQSPTSVGKEATKTSLATSPRPRSSTPGAVWCSSRQTFVVNVHFPRMTIQYYQKQKKLWEYGLRVAESEFKRNAAADGVAETAKNVTRLAEIIEQWEGRIQKLEKELTARP